MVLVGFVGIEERLVERTMTTDKAKTKKSPEFLSNLAEAQLFLVDLPPQMIFKIRLGC